MLVYVARSADEVAARLPARATVVSAGSANGATIDVDEVLRDLGARGVRSVLIEGGATTAGRFLEVGRVDALAWFRGASLLGDRGGRPALDVAAAEAPGLAPRARVEGRFAFGEDDVVIGQVVDGREAPCSRD